MKFPAASLLLVPLLVASAALAAPVARAADPPATVFITGASRGIGLELVRQYADRGWRVIATARSPEKATELAAIAARHPAVSVEPLDVTDHARIAALAAKYHDQPIDLLINNAGIAAFNPAERIGHLNYDGFRQALETNAIAPLALSEALLPNILAGHGRKIVSLSTSEASFGKFDSARLYWYRASKAALNMLMLNLASDLKPKGVAVVLLNPGAVDTDMMRGARIPLQPRAEAVTKVIGVIDHLGMESSGKFLDAGGGEVPW